MEATDARAADAAARLRRLVHAAIGPAATSSPARAVLDADPDDITSLLHPSFAAADGLQLLTTGLPASPGAASGRIVLSSEEALDLAADGTPVVLVREETTPEDVMGMQSARGIVTARGGLTSHAAVVARGWGVPAVVGADAIAIHGDEVRIGPHVLRSGDGISIDGRTGAVYAGIATLATAEAPRELEVLLGWADAFRAGHVHVRANADTAADARQAIHLGAEGIGLCRTEHMFLAPDRLPLVRRLILSDDDRTTHDALGALEEAQAADFAALLAAVGDRPVTVRLLDPPLHEFLPDLEPLVVAEARGELDGQGRVELAAVRRLREANPMLGTRAVRLGVVTPDLYPMQVRALCRALAAREAAGARPRIEVMVPLVVDRREMALARTWIEDAAAATGTEPGRLAIGTMVETPRAALLAAELAAEADFFSFGTNDLTQLVFAFSRDDVAARLLPSYRSSGLLPDDPFETIDVAGVGHLVRKASEDGRTTRPDLALGACGEHAGDPRSVRFLVSCGIDHLSCSPYRIPAARLAAAQALIEAGRVDPGRVPVPAELPAADDGSATPADPTQDDGAAPRTTDRGTDQAPPPSTGVGGAGAVPAPGDALTLVRHALRIKGFASLATVAALADVDPAVADEHLRSLAEVGQAKHHEARDMWQLTADGKGAHAQDLPRLPDGAQTALAAAYPDFLELNARLKALCTAWQIRDGEPNAHDDAGYDAGRVAELTVLHAEAEAVLSAMGTAVERMARYRTRLADAAAAVAQGDHRRFTGIMVDSYHDIWMELHEDLVLLLGIDRTAEGSF